MNLIEKLEKEIYNQTRNGRRELYILVEDLEELGYRDIKEGERQYIDRATLETLIKRYKFRYNLKADTNKPAEVIEQEERDLENVWDSIEK